MSSILLLINIGFCEAAYEGNAYEILILYCNGVSLMLIDTSLHAILCTKLCKKIKHANLVRITQIFLTMHKLMTHDWETKKLKESELCNGSTFLSSSCGSFRWNQ